MVYDIEKTKRKRVPARAHFRFDNLLYIASIPFITILMQKGIRPAL